MNNNNDNDTLQRLRNKPIAGYSHPTAVKSNRGGVYSTYNTNSDVPYKDQKTTTNKYKNEKSYHNPTCFLCEKTFEECICAVKSSLR